MLGSPLQGTATDNDWPAGTQVLYVAMGCFWGAERVFWQLDGVVSTAVGYQGGVTPNPTYEETCSGLTGHTEAVMVAHDPQRISTTDVLRTFWASHDPTQGFRQGNDRGTQYRSAVYWTTPEQRTAATATRDVYADELQRSGFGDITTDMRPTEEAGPFYYAEPYHQQYLFKVPGGYCGLGGTGVSCPVPALPA